MTQAGSDGRDRVATTVARPTLRRSLGAVAALVLGQFATQPSEAQQIPPSQAAPVQAADSIPARSGPSPGGAFLRSMVLPGWGQAASGAHSRAVFYVLVESSSAYMVIKTQGTLTAARERLAFREEAAERRARAQGIMDPDSIRAFVDADEGVEDARALEESRTQQREDWLAFGLFMLLLGGADAFVSAHLSDFPEALTVEARSLPGGGPAVAVELRIPWAPFGSGFSPERSGPGR